MPIEPNKNKGPATIITFLGLQLDTDKLEIRLPLDKLKKVKALVASWRGRKAGKAGPEAACIDTTEEGGEEVTGASTDEGLISEVNPYDEI